MDGSAATMPEAAQPIDAKTLIASFRRHLRITQARDEAAATPHDQFVSLALAVRDCLVGRLIATQTAYHRTNTRRVYYLSLEYLFGRHLRNNLVSLGLLEDVRRELAAIGIELDDVLEIEPDSGLGNGGLGRLAACYLDSAAALGYPVYGYGLRYEYGIFEQNIVDGWQEERPDYWLRLGTPWEIARPEYACPVRLYGVVEDRVDEAGRYRPTWTGYKTVVGIPYDTPIAAYGSSTVNFLRLWSAHASDAFDLTSFNRGGYVEAVREKALSETITKVLYPDDQLEIGKELRLVQQYFFVACTLADIVRRFERTNDSFDAFPDKVTIQLNDTHPALGIAELMRILVDERGLSWAKAWEITEASFGYTNHTLLPEALETWRIGMFSAVLPRHLQIVYEINARFLDRVQKRWPGDIDRVRRMSLIQETPVRAVRMAHLAIVGSRTVNGVAELHSELIRKRLVPDFAEMWPERFTNVTNGVTPRRWIRVCNPGLAAAITRRLGEGWLRDLSELRGLEPLADDAAFQKEIRAVKDANKKALADWLARRHNFRASPEALFDVQVKRMHEYKRQLLNVLHVIIRYHRLCDDMNADLPPRVVLFGAKAAPAYKRAKLVIKLINEVARTINADPRAREKLRVFFVPNYCVSVAERIMPAADLSEQISTAGTEASGTGNMKFAMNGALTIGTLDGANIEIRAAVGEENFFLFGLTAEGVAEMRPHYDPWRLYQSDPDIRRALDAIAGGEFSPHTPGLFRPIFDALTQEGDPFLLLADLRSYLEAQRRVDDLWRRPMEWTRRTILNLARIGAFSSDRSIREYARNIWRIEPLRIDGPASPVVESSASPKAAARVEKSRSSAGRRASR